MQGDPSEIQHQSQVAASGRPWWKACCIGCLLLIVATVGGVFIFLRAVTGPQDQRLTELPAAYPRDLVPYDLEAAAAIIYTPGKTRGQMMRIFSAPAKAVAGLLPASNLDVNTANHFKAAMDNYSRQMEGLDTVTIYWKGVEVTTTDVLAYYADLFKRNGLAMQSFHDEASATDYLMATRADAGMQVKVVDRPDVAGIDVMQVTVDYIHH